MHSIAPPQPRLTVLFWVAVLVGVAAALGVMLMLPAPATVTFLVDDPDPSTQFFFDGQPVILESLRQPRRLRDGTYTLAVKGPFVDPISALTFTFEPGQNAVEKLPLKRYGMIRVPPCFPPDSRVTIKGNGEAREIKNFAKPERLPVGKYELAVEGTFVEAVSQPFVLKVGDNGTLAVAKLVEYGTVAFKLDDPRPEAEFLLNGAPIVWEPLRGLHKLKAGTNTLSVTGPFVGKMITQRFTVKPGDNSPVEVSLPLHGDIKLDLPNLGKKFSVTAIGLGKAKHCFDLSKVKKLPVGSYNLNIASELLDYTHQFDVIGGQSLTLSLTNPHWKPFTNSLGMKFVRVPKGTFWMGGGGGKPGNEVTIPGDFYLGVYTVTQAEWQAVMGDNPSYFSRGGGGKDSVSEISDAELKRFPVERVSWKMALEFVTKLNEKAASGGWTYRLPTETEWEYACRGGATSKADCSYDFYFDQPTNDLSSAQANFNGGYPAGNGAKGKSWDRPVPVGSYQPNKLRLYNMHGNVWQHCADLFEVGGSARVVRGGCWYYRGSVCTASYRGSYEPDVTNYGVGFRLLAVPPRGKGS